MSQQSPGPGGDVPLPPPATAMDMDTTRAAGDINTVMASVMATAMALT